MRAILTNVIVLVISAGAMAQLACGDDDAPASPGSSGTTGTSSGTSGTSGSTSGNSGTSGQSSSGQSSSGNPNAGKLVADFGEGGVATTTLDSQAVRVHCIIQPSSGPIVIAGQGNNGLFTGYAWGMMEANGSPSVAPIGAKRIAGSLGGTVNGCTPLGDSLYLAATADSGPGATYATALKLVKTANQWVTAGSDFGADGEVGTQLGAGIDNGSEGLAAFEIGGKVLLAGKHRNGGADYKSFYLYQWTGAGQIDATFGTNHDGRVVEASGAAFFAQANAAFALPDGKLVAIGLIDGKVAAMRFSGAGELDKTFGTSGVLGSTLVATGYTVAAETKAVVGWSKPAGQPLLLARVKLDGSVDTSFGKDGQVTVEGVPADLQVADVAVSADGRIFVTGNTASSPITVVGLTSAGKLDPGFASGGIANIALPAKLTGGTPQKLGRSADGKLFVSGTCTEPPAAAAKAFLAKIDI